MGKKVKKNQSGDHTEISWDRKLWETGPGARYRTLSSLYSSSSKTSPPSTDGGVHVHRQRLRVGRLHPEVRGPSLTLLLPRQLHLVLRGPSGRPLPVLLQLPVLRGLPERARPGGEVPGRARVQRSLWPVRAPAVAHLRAAHPTRHRLHVTVSALDREAR